MAILFCFASGAKVFRLMIAVSGPMVVNLVVFGKINW